MQRYQLILEIGEALVIECADCSIGNRETVPDTEVRGRPFGLLDLTLHFLKPLPKPARGLTCSLLPVFDLPSHIGVGHRVGDCGRPHRYGRFETNVDCIRIWRLCHRKIAFEAVECRLFSRIGLQRLGGLSIQAIISDKAHSDEPVARHERSEYLQRSRYCYI